MSVVSEAEKNQVQAWNGWSRATGDAADSILVTTRRDCGVRELSLHSMDAIRPEPERANKRDKSRMVIAVRMIGGNTALISKEQFDLGPANSVAPFWCGQTFVQSFWRGAA
ncbi:hypothetical protein W02_26150 [Nitrospira sp. KM1]|nr:hypothetical protein W02_26150 [Nitrospira sp. KM1]